MLTITADNVSSLSRRQLTVSLLIIAVVFFIIGFISWINAILIPYFKIACELNNFQSYLVAFAFYMAYFFISVPASYLLKRVGLKKSIMIAFLIMACGAFTFIPAAFTRTYGIFLLGLFILGTGLAILQSAANPYITLLGPKERAAQRISMIGICNKAAGIIAPLLFAAVVLTSTDSELLKKIPLMPDAERSLVLDELIRRVIVPYAVIGSILVLLGIFIRYSSIPEIDTEHESPDTTIKNIGKSNIFHFPQLVFGVLALFLHVGTQVIAIDSIIGYARSMNVDLLEAKVFPSYTLGATIIGYIILGVICVPKVFSQVTGLRFCTMLGGALSLLIVFAHKPVHFLGHHVDISIFFLSALGFANSLIWAGIWPLALDGLGKFTKIGSSVLIMALCGNAILPLLYGYFADKVGTRDAYWVLFPCYLYLIFYAWKGHKYRKWST